MHLHYAFNLLVELLVHDVLQHGCSACVVHAALGGVPSSQAQAAPGSATAGLKVALTH